LPLASFQNIKLPSLDRKRSNSIQTAFRMHKDMILQSPKQSNNLRKAEVSVETSFCWARGISRGQLRISGLTFPRTKGPEGRRIVSHIRDLRLCVHACASIPKIRPGLRSLKAHVRKFAQLSTTSHVDETFSFKISIEETLLIPPFLYRPQTNNGWSLGRTNFKYTPLSQLRIESHSCPLLRTKGLY
jgi:hypothetical protein